jgi:hypothetical protein
MAPDRQALTSTYSTDKEQGMNPNRDPRAVALAFTEAWTRHDYATAARYVADDVVFDGPFAHLVGARAYMEGLAGFAERVTGLKVLAVLGDDERAVIMYELSTDAFGTLTGAELLVVRDGKIQTDRLTFDTFPIRQARAARAAAPV